MKQVVSTDDLGYHDGGEGNSTTSVSALFLSLLFGAPQPPIVCKDCAPTCNDSATRPKRTVSHVSLICFSLSVVTL